MSVFSSISLQDRFEIQDTLSRFCHALDHNDACAWHRLFRADAIVEAPRLGRFEGLDQVSEIPVLVARQGGGSWRHYLNNVALKPGEQVRTVMVDAYCMVANWKSGGQIVRSWDLHAAFCKAREWQIGELRLEAVSGDGRDYRLPAAPCSGAASQRPTGSAAAH